MVPHSPSACSFVGYWVMRQRPAPASRPPSHTSSQKSDSSTSAEEADCQLPVIVILDTIHFLQQQPSQSPTIPLLWTYLRAEICKLYKNKICSSIRWFWRCCYLPQNLKPWHLYVCWTTGWMHNLLFLLCIVNHLCTDELQTPIQHHASYTVVCLGCGKSAPSIGAPSFTIFSAEWAGSKGRER